MEKREKQKHRLSLYTRILLVIAVVWTVFFALSFVSSFDDWYVNHVFPVIHSVIARVFNVFPFAAGEMLMYCGAVLAALTVVLSLVHGAGILIRCIRKNPGRKSRFYRVYMKVILGIVVWLLWTYLFHWWIPYNGHVMGEETERRGYTIEEYRYVKNLIGERFRDAQKALPRDEAGRIIYPDKETAYQSVVRSMRNLSERYPRLQGYYGRPKAARCSDVLEWMRIGGYTYPYTMEITYNKYVDNLYWYTLIAHETAHYKGFYKENEGEHMGMLVCILSDDPIMVYSGCDSAYFRLLDDFASALEEEFGHEEGLRLYSQYQSEDADKMPDLEQLYLDETDAVKVAAEEYAADEHPLQEYSDTASDVADTGWETQESLEQGNYYDDSTRLIMEYFLGER